MNDYMVGSYKFTELDDDKAVFVAKKKMIEMGWRNLRLMKRYTDGWGVAKCIPSFETK